MLRAIAPVLGSADLSTTVMVRPAVFLAPAEAEANMDRQELRERLDAIAARLEELESTSRKPAGRS